MCFRDRGEQDNEKSSNSHLSVLIYLFTRPFDSGKYRGIELIPGTGFKTGKKLLVMTLGFFPIKIES